MKKPKTEPKTELPETLRGLANYFDITPVKTGWELRCKVCRAGWSIPQDAGRGGILHLFNHAFGHKPGGVT